MMNDFLKILKKAEYELTVVNGLYAADNPEFKEYFQLNTSEILSEIEDAIKMYEKSEKYPKIVLTTDNVFLAFIDEDTSVHFKTGGAFRKFMKKYNPKIELVEIKHTENKELDPAKALRILSASYPPEK